MCVSLLLKPNPVLSLRVTGYPILICLRIIILSPYTPPNMRRNILLLCVIGYTTWYGMYL